MTTHIESALRESETMQTRQSSTSGGQITTTPLPLSDALGKENNVATDSFQSPQPREPVVEQTEADWIRQMHECEELQWRGGDNFWDGPHDNFCFVCGSGMELFCCQTCENCYHAECMSPSLDPDEVPSFWFCPHCVNRELHIPPSSPATNYQTFGQTVTHVYPSPESTLGQQEMQPEPVNQDRSSTVDRLKDIHDHVSSGQLLTGKAVDSSPTGQEPRSAAKSRPRPAEYPESESHPGHVRSGRQRRTRSPPRKKSKYSTFSVEVDKALSVLHAELEIAARGGKSEGNLQDQRRVLEQQLKMQEGQLTLNGRELESVRKQLVSERSESARLRAENSGLQEQVLNLKRSLEKRDAELQDWRMKLRSMMGVDSA